MKKIIVVLAVVIIYGTVFALVENDDKPLNGTWDFQMKKVWEIDGAGDTNFASLREIIISKEGDIFVQDSKYFKIHKFSKDGKYITSFGEKGEGPGEVKEMETCFTVDKYLLIPDRSNIHFFLKDGRYSRAVPFDSRLYPRAFISRQTFISAPLVYSRSSKRPVNISIFDLVTQTKKDIAEYKPFKNATSVAQEGNTRVSVSIIIHSITPIMIVGHRDEKIYYGMSTSYGISCVDKNGKQLFCFNVRGRERKKLTKSFLDQLHEELCQMSRGFADKIIKGLPDRASYFERIEADKNGFIYVFISDPNNKSGSEIDIFSPEGKYLYSSEIKVEEDKSMGRIGFRDNDLVIEVEDEDGEISIRKYNISLPGL